MLRHYDKIGLLKPAAILENGYRAYTSAQIPAVAQIRLYQSCRFSLSEIGELLCADRGRICQLAGEKLKQLEAQDNEERLAFAELTRLSQMSPPTYENRYEISFTEQPAQKLFSCAGPVSITDADAAINQLYEMLEKVQAEPSGLLLLLIDLEKDGACRVAVPVRSDIRHEGGEMIEMGAAWYLSTFHFGSYYSIGMAYDRLLCYGAEKSFSLEMPFMERYFVDAEYAISPARYITQILVKITP